MSRAKQWRAWPMGLGVGLLNGFFGAGGGMVGVPLLRRMGLSPRECHATCIAIIAPLAAVSAWLYLREGAFVLSDALIYLPGGLAGAALAGWLLPHLQAAWLHRIFGCLILIAAGRLLLG